MSTNEVWQRRELLSPAPNPDRTVDYVVTLSGTLQGHADSERLSVTVRYVPDRLIIPPEAFKAYLDSLAATISGPQENLATTSLADISNEIVARWIQVTTRVDTVGAGPNAPVHQVMAEDRQPGWDNPSLLAMIAGT